MCRSKNILIVDDNSDDQHLICMLFRRMQMSFYVTFCSSLAGAREKLSEVVFDVIVLDGTLSTFPDRSMGYDLIPDIKSSASCKAKIIMFSGQDEYVTEGMNRGADYGFSKNLLMQPMKFSESFDSLIPAKVPIPQSGLM